MQLQRLIIADKLIKDIEVGYVSIGEIKKALKGRGMKPSVELC